MQGQLPEVDTIIPTIFGFDKAYLTNFSGDKSIWPLHMTIGNILKYLHRGRSTRAWICNGLLLMVTMDGMESRMQWHAVVHHILQLLRISDLLYITCSNGFT